MNNPSLRQIPRHEIADVIPSKQELSLLNWLESSGRLLERDNQEPDYDLNEEDLAGIMDVDDVNDYDYDDTDDDEAPLEEET